MRARDLTASLSVAGLVLPEAVAYAAIAGLPPQRAILAAIVGALAYAIAGKSRFAIVAPTSSSAAILGASLAVMSPDAGVRLGMATVVVAMVGAFFLIAAALRLGALSAFISRPVLRGFAFGLAATIILKQLPVIVGVPVPAPDLWRLISGLAASVPTWHPASLATGALALVALMLLRRLRSLPGAFLVLAAGVAASFALDLPARGVATVGEITLTAPVFALPALPWHTLVDLGQLVVPLVLVLFAESWGTIRALALRHGDATDPNRELGALGFANVAAALAQGMPVGAGFSAGAASEAAGARSRLTGAVSALGLLALMLFAAPLVARLPLPVVAAVVIAALMHALDPSPLVRLWRVQLDGVVALVAAAGVLAFGILNGMLFAILLSLAALVRRMAAAKLARLGRLDGGHDYVDIVRHPDAEVPARLAIWRPAEPLFFANAERILSLIAEAQAAEPETRTVIVSIERTDELDSTTLDALIEFDTLMRSRGVTVRLARVRDELLDLIVKAGAKELAERCTYSVDDAVVAAAAAPA